jgi:hypothetical protein
MSVSPLICTIFASSAEPLSQFQPKVDTNHSWGKGMETCSNKGQCSSSRGKKRIIGKGIKVLHVNI